ncbi:AKT-interacting protein-like isoform X3 [Eriocheir sinensis]|uniref:AKT-interacting protein-like isoform X3 n=1 Tax=Eriocheir sinensis TaxID=95602 RepID=UPI0021C720A8|nr:AKT-interacting protein-like isoform X3 [Eriocheir sinensis]XP_050707819.1 AKT-interacting protein-like isoform X3 [Eriocheir sinensis]
MASVAPKLSDSGGPADGRGRGGEGGGGGGREEIEGDQSALLGGGGGGGGLSRSSSTRGSLRKVLPSVPDMDQQLSMAAKMIDRRTSTPKGNHSYSPYFLEYTLLAEYNLLQKQRVSGVYVVPSGKTPLVWFGVIFIRQGIYQEGIFRFNLHIPENYPDGDVPTVVFETPVFHPLVSPDTRQLDIRRGFANKWRRNVNHLWHVLLYVRRCFYKIETSHPLNPEAAVLYDSDNEMFQLRVRSCVEESKRAVLDPPSAAAADPHAIVFSPFQPAVHDPVLDELKKERAEVNGNLKEGGGNCNGLSWVKPGTLQIFSQSAS